MVEMTGRTYGHFCPLACTLDLVGDRWALLVLRELLAGPQRYTDLLGRLPGIGTNQLATRLHELERADIIRRRTLPPPSAATVYEYTQVGRGLEEAILALARFGLDRLGPQRGTSMAFRPSWAALALRCRAGLGPRPSHLEMYETRVENEVFHTIASPGGVSTAGGPAIDPLVRVRLDTITAFELARRELGLAAAIAGERLEAEGAPDALRRWASVHGIDQ